MISGQTLLDFAKANGFVIPPYRDVDLWAQEINAAEGKCACGLTCPCQQAINDIANAESPKEERCRCTMFVSEAYGNEWAKEWEKYNRKNKKVQEAKQQREPTEQWEIKTPAIKSLKNVIEEAIAAINEGRPADAYDMIIAEKEKHPDCDACQGYLDELAARANLQIAVCNIDEERCAVDAELTEERAVEIIEFYTEVDKEMVENPNMPPELDNINGEQREYTTDHHACVSRKMRELKETIPDQHKRLVEAARSCSTKNQ